MKRTDLEAGHVYAYQESRYGSTRAVLILDTHVCTKDGSGDLVATAGQARRGGWHTMPRGIPAVLLAFEDNDADYKSKAARALELVQPKGTSVLLTPADRFLHQRSVLDGIDAQTGESARLGRLVLVTNSAYLKGDYLEVMAERREVERLRDERITAQREQNERDDRAFAKLHRWLEQLGINVPIYRDSQLVRNLSMDDLHRLLTMAENTSGSLDQAEALAFASAILRTLADPGDAEGQTIALKAARMLDVFREDNT